MKNIIKYIINILLVISFCLMDYFIIDLNIIPFKFLFLICGITLIIVGLLIFLFICKKSIIILVIEVLFIILSLFITSKIILTSKFFDQVKNIEETTIYYVIVDIDSNYNDINDLVETKMGIINIESSSYSKAINNIDNYIKIDIIKYKNVSMLLKDLSNKNIDSILINSASIDIINEIDETFLNNIKIIKEIKIIEEIEDNNDITIKDPINILISGIDTYGDINTVSRSDVNIIVTINPNTNEIVLTSIPRDMHLYLHGITEKMDKLTHSGYYGIKMTKETIEDFLEIKIDYYFKVNFTSLVKLVDSIGGVDVVSDTTFSESGYTFYEGVNHLNGNQALMYARIRRAFVDGDFVRGEHQKQIIEAIIKKVSSSKTILLNYNELLDSLGSLFQTNIPTTLMKEYVKLQLDSNPSWRVLSLTTEGFVSKAEVYSLPGVETYITEPYEHIRKKCSTIINGVKMGFEIDKIK